MKTLMVCLAAANMFVAGLAAPTPTSYVQTDGNSAFPTDLTLEFPARIEMLHSSANYASEASYALFGYNATDYHQLFIGGSENRLMARKHTKECGFIYLRNAAGGTILTKDDWYNATFVFGADYISGDLDGNNVVTVANSWPIDKEKPYLFGWNDQLKKTNYKCMAAGSRLARCRIFSGADQIHPARDYYPALGTDGTTACLYDHVTKQRVFNALNGTFTAVGVAGRYAIDVDSCDRGGGVSLDGEGEVVFRDSGASVTVTATEDNVRRFVYWIGDVSDFEDVTAKSVTFSVSGDRKILALYTGSALFDVSTGILRVPDGDWQLKGSVKNSSARTITLGTGTAGGIYLSGSGKLDLDVPVFGTDGRMWTIAELSTKAFAIGDNGAGLGTDGYERLTELVLPKSLQEINSQFLSIPYGLKDKRRLKKLVMDLPQLKGKSYGSGADAWTGFYSGFIRNYADSLTNLVMRLPGQFDNVAPQFFDSYDSKSVVDSLVNVQNAYDEWDFSGTKSLNAGMDATFAYNTLKMSGGTLRLPSLVSATGKGFNYSTIENLELGNLSGSMTAVGSSSSLFSKSEGLRTVVLSATDDPSVEFRIYGNAFSTSTTSLKAVFLTTDRVPTFDGTVIAQAPAFGRWDHPEKSMCIYVPENSTAFASILASARASADFNQAAAEAWASANNLPVPVGVVPAIGTEGSLGTTRMQYIGVIDPQRYLANRKGPDIAVGDALAALGEKVMVDSTSTASCDGFYRGDVRFTLTATCEERVNGSLTSEFAGWYVNGSHTNLVTANPFSFTPMDDGIVSVRPKFVRPWLYDAAAGTIWNGDWKLKVQVVDGGLKVAGVDAAAYGNAFVTMGKGELDLSAPVRDSSSVLYAIVSVGARALSRQNTVVGDGPKAIVYPTTLTSIDAGSADSYCADPYSAKLNRVEMACPELVAEFAEGSLIAGETGISDLYLSMPKVTAVGAQPLAEGCTNVVADVGEWDLSGLTSLSAGLFTDQAKMTGTLRLPRVASLPENALSGSGIGALELGAFSKTRLGAIAASACADMANLEKIVFGPRATALTVAADAFSGTPGIRRIEFQARMPTDTSAVANMLAEVPLLDAKQAMVVGSAGLGLERYRATSPAYTPGEEAAAASVELDEGETLVGVCLDSQRKAWLVGRDPVCELPGLAIILR